MKYILLLLSLFVGFFSYSSYSYSYSNSIFINTDNQVNYCNDEGDCGIIAALKQMKVAKDLESKRSASQYIQAVVVHILRFLALISTLIIIYSGFVMLTSIGNEEKVKKSKKIIIYALLGLVIIFIAGPLTDLVIGILNP